MTPTRFLLALTMLFVVFVLARIYEHNLFISKLYQLQKLEAVAGQLRQKIEDQRVLLEALKSPGSLHEEASRRGLVATHSLHAFPKPRLV